MSSWSFIMYTVNWQYGFSLPTFLIQLLKLYISYIKIHIHQYVLEGHFSRINYNSSWLWPSNGMKWIKSIGIKCGLLVYHLSILSEFLVHDHEQVSLTHCFKSPLQMNPSPINSEWSNLRLRVGQANDRRSRPRRIYFKLDPHLGNFSFQNWGEVI